MHALAGVVAASLKGLRRVQSDANPRSEPVLGPVSRERALDGDRTVECGIGSGERDEESVALVTDFLAALGFEAGAQRPVVPAL
jgi:hypothetical protein